MNIVLIGFMGTGKSTLGHLLAQNLNWAFLDTDQAIEVRQGCSISEIFSQEGEAFFRRLENELAQELQQSDALVIATGGGFPLNPENIRLLREKGLIVALTATPQAIYERIRLETHRPLVAQGDLIERITTLLDARKTIYQNADLTLDTTQYDLDTMVAAIAAELTKRGCRDGENSSQSERTQL